MPVKPPPASTGHRPRRRPRAERTLQDRVASAGAQAVERRTPNPVDPEDRALLGLDELREAVGRDPLWRRVKEQRAIYRPRIVEGPEELWELCSGYFQWVHDNPLYEARSHATREGIILASSPKMRAMTIIGLCVYLGISRTTWETWRKPEVNPDLSPVCQLVEYVIWEQKFTGAAANLLNAQLIARDLGLADRSEISGPDGGPIRTEEEVKDARAVLAGRIADLLARRRQGGDPGGVDEGGSPGAS